MQFLFPGFLWALGLLAVPIIIHLFYFRRTRRVLFSSIEFLKEIKEEQSARQRLRNLLLLLARLLALAFLIFAFAQPFIPGRSDVKKGARSVSIFVDNSFSMQADNNGVPNIELAKESARQIISSLNDEDRIQILTNDFEGKHQRWIDKQTAQTYVDAIKWTPVVHDLKEVIGRQRQMFAKSENNIRQSYLVSDFQKNISDLGEQADTSFDIFAIPLQSEISANLSIDTCYFESPVQILSQNNRMIVRLHNWSNREASNIRLELDVDGLSKPVGSLNIPAGKSVTDTINISVAKGDWHEGSVRISDYPVQFDDIYYFTFYTPPRIKVLSVYQGQPDARVSALLKNVTPFEGIQQTAGAVNYGVFGTYNLIVLENLPDISSGLATELTKYIQTGGNVLVFLPEDASLAGYNSFLSSNAAATVAGYKAGDKEVSNINTEEFVFKDVFENKKNDLYLPHTKGNYAVTNNVRSRSENIMTYRDGSIYIGKYSIGAGHLYLSTAPLDSKINNLTLNAELFVPMIYRMSVSSGQAKASSYVIGNRVLASVPYESTSEDNQLHVKGKNEFIPGIFKQDKQAFLDIRGQVSESGIYRVTDKNNNLVQLLALNYDRRESDNRLSTEADLGGISHLKLIKTADPNALSAIVKEENQGITLWRLCLILALTFLLAEVLIVRFYKK